MLAEDLRARFGELVDASVPAITISIGAASRKPVDSSPTDLVQRADNRLYRAKRARLEVDLTAGASSQAS
jgi:PleD family two-component response regulator